MPRRRRDRVPPQSRNEGRRTAARVPGVDRAGLDACHAPSIPRRTLRGEGGQGRILRGRAGTRDRPQQGTTAMRFLPGTVAAVRGLRRARPGAARALAPGRSAPRSPPPSGSAAAAALLLAPGGAGRGGAPALPRGLRRRSPLGTRPSRRGCSRAAAFAQPDRPGGFRPRAFGLGVAVVALRRASPPSPLFTLAPPVRQASLAAWAAWLPLALPALLSRRRRGDGLSRLSHAGPRRALPLAASSGGSCPRCSSARCTGTRPVRRRRLARGAAAALSGSSWPTSPPAPATSRRRWACISPTTPSRCSSSPCPAPVAALSLWLAPVDTADPAAGFRLLLVLDLADDRSSPGARLARRFAPGGGRRLQSRARGSI